MTLSSLKTLALLTVAATALSLGACKDTGEKMAAQAVAPTPAKVLAAVIANPVRAEAAVRDGARHPAATLDFFGLTPDMSVIEIWPGGGYYADILYPYLQEFGGKYIAGGYPESSERRIAANAKFIADRPNAALIPFAKGSSLVTEGGVDMVLTFRNVHNWMGGEYSEDAFGQFYAALKPGGHLGLVEHRLPATAEQDPRGSTGYVQQAYVIKLAAEAGFTLVKSSEINANPKDVADHPMGVWTLPPTLKNPDDNAGFDKAVYEAIGESDRMTLLFVKPK
ncbi:MAG: methyltransferase [Robiginitomaculum sp.]